MAQFPLPPPFPLPFTTYLPIYVLVSLESLSIVDFFVATWYYRRCRIFIYPLAVDIAPYFSIGSILLRITTKRTNGLVSNVEIMLCFGELLSWKGKKAKGKYVPGARF